MNPLQKSVVFTLQVIYTKNTHLYVGVNRKTHASDNLVRYIRSLFAYGATGSKNRVKSCETFPKTSPSDKL